MLQTPWCSRESEAGSSPEDAGENRIFWQAQSLADIPDSDEWLSPSEKAIARRLSVPKRLLEWRLGRWTAKQSLCSYLAGSGDWHQPSAVEIHAAPDGAPCAFLGGKQLPVSISISHSRDHGLCVVAGAARMVGCDLEWLEPRDEHFIEDYFAPEEVLLMARQVGSAHSLAANLIWSAKESALKALHQGLRRDTRSVVARLDPIPTGRDWDPFTVQCRESGRTFYGWWRSDGRFVWTMVGDTIAVPVPLAKPQQMHHGDTESQ